MRILNENNVEITSPDLSKGYLSEDTVFVQHHEAVEAIAEQGHYEVIAEYPNGGKDVAWIVDVPGVEAKDAWDEYENVYRYVLYAEEEPKTPEGQQFVTWDELDMAYQTGCDEGYTEGVNGAYDK